MWLNTQFPADLVTFTEEILNGKLHVLCSGTSLHLNNFLWSACDRMILLKSKITSISQGTELLRIIKFLHIDFIVKKKKKKKKKLMNNLGYSHLTFGTKGCEIPAVLFFKNSCFKTLG